VLIVTRRRLLLALAFVVCVAVGMGFVLGRRTDTGLKQPLAHESEEAAGKTVTDELTKRNVSRTTLTQRESPLPIPSVITRAPDLIPADKAVPDEAVPDEALIDEPVAEMIAIVPKVKMPIFYVETKEPAVALTFDISWGSNRF